MFLSFFILKEGAKKEFYLGKKLIQKKNLSKKDVHCRRKCHWWEIILAAKKQKKKTFCRFYKNILMATSLEQDKIA
jgi:hypothetical protein